MMALFRVDTSEYLITWPFQSHDLVINSPFSLSYILYIFSFENLVFNQIIPPDLPFPHPHHTSTWYHIFVTMENPFSSFQVA